MVDLRNWMGRLIPHQACEVLVLTGYHRESDSQGVRGKGISEMIWLVSLSEQAFLLQHLQQGQSSLH